MEYGLRRYEAAQRLLWFLYFLICLALAYPVANSYTVAAAGAVGQGAFQAELLKSKAFWTQLQWILVEPSGRIMVYMIWVALLFIGLRFVWLVVQYVGNYLLKRTLDSKMNAGRKRGGGVANAPQAGHEKLYSTELLIRDVERFPLRFLFHPYQRLRLLLANPQGALASEDLNEKERRIVETDWHVILGSWAPFGWLMWLLPLTALFQACYLFAQQVQPAIAGQKDFQDVFGFLIASLLPVLQVIGLTIVFRLSSALLKRFEELYLSNVDALLYDQFLSRLPFQSSDTVILMEVMERHYQELQSALRRIERFMGREKEKVVPGVKVENARS
ncbi:MAG: hypothetical protein ABFD98_02890 [Syntrophobacteraceae bacterium]|nr:hypothetical protein [Desulfobacteraceae bacterium]